MATRTDFTVAHVFAVRRDKARLTAHQAVPWILKTAPSDILFVDGQIAIVPSGQTHIVDAVATGAPNAVQTQFVVQQILHRVAVGSDFARHVRLVVSLRRVAGRAEILDGLAVGGVDQPFVIHFGLPKRVPGAVRHQGRLPIRDRAHGCAIFIDQRMALWVGRMAIDAVARTGEIHPFLCAELSHPPARPLGIVLAKPLVRILCARQQLPKTEGHQWHKKGDVGSAEHGRLIVSLQS